MVEQQGVLVAELVDVLLETDEVVVLVVVLPPTDRYAAIPATATIPRTTATRAIFREDFIGLTTSARATSNAGVHKRDSC